MEQEYKINVLYVDDEDNNLKAFKASFRRDFNVFTSLSALEAKNILEKQEIHVLITDQRMPVVTGTELLAETVKLYPDQVRILLTGFSDIDALKDAINRGHIFCYLQKPWKDAELKQTIYDAFKVYRLKKEKDELNKQLIVTNEQLEFYLRQKILS